MSAVAYQTSGTYGTYACNTIEQQYFNGQFIGTAINSDSQNPTYN